jgi:hypothetical protein
MSITLFDRVEFAAIRLFNRTIGKYLFNWDHNGIMFLGYGFMLKSTVAALNSPRAMANLKAGLTHEEFCEVYRTLESTSMLPRPELPDGNFTSSQKAKYGITLLFNKVYVYRTN